MEVRNYDRNGNFIPDLSKIVLPDELGAALYRVFEKSAKTEVEKNKEAS